MGRSVFTLVFFTGFVAPFALDALTVGNITVSFTAQSLEKAREQAIERAHQLAFQKLREEYFPDSSQKTTPPPTQLTEMVENFSIEKEKNGTDNKTYTASLRFEFDRDAVHKWFEQNTSSTTPATITRGMPLKVKVSYASLPQWQGIKQILQTFPEGHDMRLLSITTRNAEIELPYGRDGLSLQQKLQGKELMLRFEQGHWTLE